MTGGGPVRARGPRIGRLSAAGIGIEGFLTAAVAFLGLYPSMRRGIVVTYGSKSQSSELGVGTTCECCGVGEGMIAGKHGTSE